LAVREDTGAEDGLIMILTGLLFRRQDPVICFSGPDITITTIRLTRQWAAATVQIIDLAAPRRRLLKVVVLAAKAPAAEELAALGPAEALLEAVPLAVAAALEAVPLAAAEAPAVAVVLVGEDPVALEPAEGINPQTIEKCFAKISEAVSIHKLTASFLLYCRNTQYIQTATSIRAPIR